MRPTVFIPRQNVYFGLELQVVYYFLFIKYLTVGSNYRLSRSQEFCSPSCEAKQCPVWVSFENDPNKAHKVFSLFLAILADNGSYEYKMISTLVRINRRKVFCFEGNRPQNTTARTKESAFPKNNTLFIHKFQAYK